MAAAETPQRSPICLSCRPPPCNQPATVVDLPKSTVQITPARKIPYNSSCFQILPVRAEIKHLPTMLPSRSPHQVQQRLMTPGMGKGWLSPPCPDGPSCQSPFGELLLIEAKSFQPRLLPLNRPPWALQSCHLAAKPPLHPGTAGWQNGIGIGKPSCMFNAILQQQIPSLTKRQWEQNCDISEQEDICFEKHGGDSNIRMYWYHESSKKHK